LTKLKRIEAGRGVRKNYVNTWIFGKFRKDGIPEKGPVTLRA